MLKYLEEIKLLKKLALITISLSLVLALSGLVSSPVLADNISTQPVQEAVQNNGPKELSHNITTISEDVTVNKNERVYGNITTVSGNINVYGEVFGNITTATGGINLKSSAKVNGNITTGTGIINKEQGAEVRGNTFEGTGTNHNRNYSRDQWPQKEKTSTADRVLNSLGTLLGLMAITAIMLSIFPLNLQTMSSALNVETGRVVLVGLLGWIVLPFVLLVSVLTIVGPIIIGLGAFVSVLAGTVIIAQLLGDKLYEVFKWSNENKILKALVGLAVLWFASLLPIANVFILITCSVIGMGVVLVTKFGTGRPWFPPRRTSTYKPAQEVIPVEHQVIPVEPKELNQGGAEDEPKEHE